jgi:uncharacterized protein (TIGR02266 family)
MPSTGNAWAEPEAWADAEESVVRLKSRPAGAERRVTRRLPIEIDVTVEGGACRFTTTTFDLSPGGVFIASYESIPIGTELVLSFALPSGTPLEVIGIVQWRRGSLDEAPQGMGVSFFCLDPEAKKVLERFCAVREPLYYEDTSTG